MKAPSVVLVSGGLDSTTLLAFLSKQQKEEVYPLFVNYGQVSAAHETKAVKTVVRRLGLILEKRMLDLRGVASSGAFSRRSSLIRQTHFADVPGRNAFLIIAAANFAMEIGASTIFTGFISPYDGVVVKDQTHEFISQMQKTLRAAYGRELSLSAPYIGLKKHAVLYRACRYQRLGWLNLADVWTCYTAKMKPCGVCGSCYALERAGDINAKYPEVFALRQRARKESPVGRR